MARENFTGHTIDLKVNKLYLKVKKLARTLKNTNPRARFQKVCKLNIILNEI